jgi:NarL family two-component system response regulator LiaR
MNETIKILIVDDHPMVRRGLAVFIDSQPDLHLVGEAADAAKAFELYQRHLPDVVLMDMVMPGQDGATAIRHIRQEFPHAAIIALTSYGDDTLIEAALGAGARGFLYKDVSSEELAEAIRQTHRGRTILDAKASEVMLRLVSEHTSPAVEAPRSDFSERELLVLKYLVDGLTNKQIAVQLGIQPSTIKQYLRGIFAKLNVQSRAEAVGVALRLGVLKQ